MAIGGVSSATMTRHVDPSGVPGSRVIRRIVGLTAVALLAILLPTAANAAPIPITLTWSGADGGLWSAESNWTPPVAPANGDSLVFSGSGRTVNDIPALNIDAITINTGTGRVIEQSGASSLTLTGGVTFAGNPTIDHPIALDGGQRTITGPASGTATLTFSKALRGFGGLDIDATAVVLSGEASDYAGATNINRGIVRLMGPATLGSTAAGTKVAAGTTLDASASSVPLSEPLNLAGEGVSGANGALVTGGIGPDVSGPIQLDATARVQTNRISGKISGPGALQVNVLAGGYARVSNAANDYTGGTNVLTGFVAPDAVGALGTGDVSLEINGGIHVSGGVVTPNNVAAAMGDSATPSTTDIVETGPGGGGLRRLTTTGSDTTVYRRISVHHPLTMNSVHGTGWLIAVGNVAITLGSTASTFGAIFHNFAILSLDGYPHRLGDIRVGGILDLGVRIDGTVGGLDAVKFDVDGGALRLRFAAAGPAAGASMVRVDGNVRLDSALLDVVFSGSFPVGRQVILIDNRGSSPVDGRFIGLSEGAYLTAGGANFRISYAGGDGNDVVLTRTAGRSDRDGYWMVSSAGAVYAFGDATHYGNAPVGARPAVDIEPSPTGSGYWVVDDRGGVFAFGDAGFFGASPALNAGESVTSLSATPTGLGYWLFTNRGRVLPYGDAGFFGDVSKTTLNGPVLDSVPTPSGNGYYMVASDGGVFAFGDAAFAGSMGDQRLNQPVQSLVPDSDGAGYWLVAADGGIFAFAAGFHGSVPGVLGPDKVLNQPIKGMVGSATGGGYLMVAADGGIFAFGDVRFRGSLGGNPPPAPVVSVATLPQ